MATAKRSKPKKAATKKTATGSKRVQAQAKSIRERATSRLRDVAGETRDMTRRKAAQFAVSMVEFQKTTMGNAIDVIGKVQDQTGKFLHDIVKKASWVPSEGRDVVDEWNHTVKKGREDFRKTSDKSFDLIVKYLKRVQKEGGPKSTAKISTAKKKAATRKKSTAKKKTATRKKSTARKKAPVRSTTS